MAPASNVSAAARILVVLATMAIVALAAFPSIAEAKKRDPSSPGQPETPSPGHDQTAVGDSAGRPCSNAVGVEILNNPIPVNKWVVEISNMCPNCPLSNLLLNCPGFVAGTIVDPAIFKNNGDGTCTVKNGNVIAFQEKLRFQYFQVYKNSLSVRSLVWHC